jgi:hypothetical protein
MANYRLIQRKDTEANWSAVVPAEGEIAFVDSGANAGRFKIGDGSTTYAGLDYATPETPNPAGGQDNFLPIAGPTATGTAEAETLAVTSSAGLAVDDPANVAATITADQFQEGSLLTVKSDAGDILLDIDNIGNAVIDPGHVTIGDPLAARVEIGPASGSQDGTIKAVGAKVLAVAVDVPNADGTYLAAGHVDDDARFIPVANVGQSGAAVQALDAEKVQVTDIGGGVYQFRESSSSSSSRVDCGVIPVVSGIGGTYEVELTTIFPSVSNIAGQPGGNGMTTDIGFFVRAASDYTSCIMLQQTFQSGSSARWALRSLVNGTTTTIIESATIDTTTLGISYPITSATWTIAVAGDTMTVYVQAAGMASRAQILTGTVTALSGQTGVGFGIEGTAAVGEYVTQFVVRTATSGSLNRDVFGIIPANIGSVLSTLLLNSASAEVFEALGDGRVLKTGTHASNDDLLNRTELDARYITNAFRPQRSDANALGYVQSYFGVGGGISVTMPSNGTHILVFWQWTYGGNGRNLVPTSSDGSGVVAVTGSPGSYSLVSLDPNQVWTAFSIKVA